MDTHDRIWSTGGIPGRTIFRCARILAGRTKVDIYGKPKIVGRAVRWSGRRASHRQDRCQYGCEAARWQKSADDAPTAAYWFDLTAESRLRQCACYPRQPNRKNLPKAGNGP